MSDIPKYVIFNTNETGSIDFSEVKETSSDTLSISKDGSQTFVGYYGNMPNSVQSLSSKSEEMDESTFKTKLTEDYQSIWRKDSEIDEE
tara:strand:- start:41 stop:307 length:267 start_codon:yes stop_codon:yes gene_type:complete